MYQYQSLACVWQYLMLDLLESGTLSKIEDMSTTMGRKKYYTEPLYLVCYYHCLYYQEQQQQQQ